MSPKALSHIRRKLRIINHGKESHNVSLTCRHFGISRETYYKGKRGYEEKGEASLTNSKPCPQSDNTGQDTCLE
jgi:transposase-like protein